MAPTPWAYFTPFREQPVDALRALQAWCIEHGKHKAKFPNRQARIDDLQVALKRLQGEDTPVGQMFRDELVDRLRAVQERPAPETFDEAVAELRWLNAEAHTHSPLDLLGVSLRPSPLHAAPLEAETLRAMFGTERPDKATVAARVNDLLNLRGVGEAVYVETWAAGQRDETLFCGVTGV